MSAIRKTMKEISNITILVVIFVFTFMLIGLELYAYRVKFNDQNKLDLTERGTFPKSNFNTPLNSLLTVFIVIANDGWTEILLNHARATDFISSSVFFIIILFLGQFILYNLFIAIMIENFEQLSVRYDLTNKLNKIKPSLTFKERIRKLFSFMELRVKPIKAPALISEEELEEEMQMKDSMMRQQPSLFLFRFDGPIRRGLNIVLKHEYFERVMLFIIVASSLQLAVDNPLDNPESTFQRTLIKVEYILTSIFIVEALIKVIAFGFLYCGSTSYMKSAWNALDLFVVIVTVSYSLSSHMYSWHLML